VNNTGAAFGLWQDSRVLLTLFSIVSVFWIICYLLCRPGRTHAFAWSLIAGGALGNLVDRLAYGYVIDYLDFHIWPVFNLADACICVGVAWIVIRFMVHPPKPSSKTHASDPL
jgi:signal peptidase II